MNKTNKKINVNIKNENIVNIYQDLDVYENDFDDESNELKEKTTKDWMNDRSPSSGLY